YATWSSVFGFIGESCPRSPSLLDRLVLDVVLGRVLVGELVHDVHPVRVRVVDLDERLPFVGEGVLGEDRLDRALRFARAAVGAVDTTGQRERVLLGDDGTEDVLVLALRQRRDAIDAPERLAG